MAQLNIGRVRELAPRRPRLRPAAICRKSAGALALAAILAGCGIGTEPGGNGPTGSLTVSVSGLPPAGAAAVTVTGASGYQRTLSGTETLTGLPPGTYSVSASAVTASGDQYSPLAASQTVGVAAHNTPATVSVAYSATTGRVQVPISGIPPGATPAVVLTGPDGYSRALAASDLLTGLSPGEYTLTSSLVTEGGMSYLAAPSTQSVLVSAGATAVATVTYFASTGGLAVTITGLPGGVPAAVTVSGPAGFSQSLAGSQTLSGLAPGTYAVQANPVTAGGTSYSASPTSQSVGVSAGGMSSATISYAPPGQGASLDLRVDGLYLTQAVQRYDGSVPLVAGRDAYLRAFVLANSANGTAAQVRVRLYHGTTLVEIYAIPAPGAGVPTSVNEGSLAASWNVLVPGSLVQPGLRILAEVDPTNTVAEADENNNAFPLSGEPAAVDVRALSPFQVRFVPVLQQANGLAGNVHAGNMESFLADLKAMLPVGAYEADLRAVYTTTAPALMANNANNAWTTVLNEVLALRTADASTRYYYGVVRTGYTSGTAGMGYIGGNARTSIGWDYLPSGSSVMAHELGHNMGRLHAPCGSVLGPDPWYPYPGGTIGVFGLALSGLAVKPPSTADIMGYCQSSWISDYNWSAMIAYREGGQGGQGGQGGGAAGASGGEGLLVWGRITAGGIVLEPAFRVPAAAGTAPRPGPHEVELLDGAGRVIRSARFDAPEIADLPDGPERHFAFVVPLGGAPEVAVLRVRASGRTALGESRSGRGDPEFSVTRSGAERIAVRWNASRYPMVLVRDGQSDRILSFARGGNAVLWSRAAEVELQFSDGVRTAARRERILK